MKSQFVIKQKSHENGHANQNNTARPTVVSVTVARLTPIVIHLRRYHLAALTTMIYVFRGYRMNLFVRCGTKFLANASYYKFRLE